MSKYSDEESIRKVLPFIITTIGGSDDLKKWKEGQLIEWEELKRRRQAKFNAIKELSTEWKVDRYESKSHARMTKGLNAWVPDKNDNFFGLDRDIPSFRFSERFKQESYFKQLTNKAIDWFLSLQF